MLVNVSSTMIAISSVTFQRDPETVYPLLGDDLSWHTGIAQDGHQVLVVPFPHYDLVSLFDRTGKLTAVHELPRKEEQELVALSGQENGSLNDFLNRIGFHCSVIRVHRFFLPNYSVGIADIPAFYRDILEHPTTFHNDEHEAAQALLDRWSAEGLFEILLGEHIAMWIDRSGHIIAT